ncbi:hypothetical protein PG990_008387 [Apiospora arundinis]
MPDAVSGNSDNTMALKSSYNPATTSYTLAQYLQSQPSTTAERQEAELIGSRDQSESMTALYIKKWEMNWEQGKDDGKN